MKKQIFLFSMALLFFLFHNNCLKAQQYEFYIGSGTSWFNENEYTQSYESFTYFPIVGSDSLWLRTPILTEQTNKNQFDVLANFEVGAKMTWPILDQLSIGTGIGLFNLNFRAKRQSLTSSFITTGPGETVVFPTTNIFSNNDCDYYTNNPVYDYDGKTTFNVIGLAIPLALTYDVVPERLQLSFGASLRTPIHGVRKRNVTSIDMEADSQGETACTYRLHEDKNTSVADLNDMMITGDFEISGWIKRFGLSLAISNWTNSVFSKNNDAFSFTFSDQATKPGYYTLRLKYRLGDFEKEGKNKK